MNPNKKDDSFIYLLKRLINKLQENTIYFLTYYYAFEYIC